MNIEPYHLNVTTSIEYFEPKEIDWEGNNTNNNVSIEQAHAVQNILTTEVSIYLLRRTSGICGSLVDNMVDIRRRFINEYEKTYGNYIEYNDFD